MQNFTGKVAAITGAGSGIGQELALALARRGCHLALCCDRNMEGLQQTADSTRSLGVEVTSQRLDVADRGAVYAWTKGLQFIQIRAQRIYRLFAPRVGYYELRC